MMEKKPIHYDGSMQNHETSMSETNNQPFNLTDEARLNIATNPYESEQIEFLK
ncbi:hypothetical protein [Halalkalibacter okhensis]|uniref:hypothetical protein n=1 Tax=Halalkalibacter okhensis TaxID=333138 RepID=UPI000A7A08E1|nr:hypothetical protein [Halalkalibacter okhensis]